MTRKMSDYLRNFSSGVSQLNDLTDVNTVSVKPQDKQALVYNDEYKMWVPGNVSGSGGAIEILDEGILVTSEAKKINFYGADVYSFQDDNGVVNVLIPAPNYAAFFNTNNEVSDARIIDVATSKRYISSPYVEGNPFKIGNWSGNTIHDVVNSSSIVYTTSDYFSCIDQTTTLNVKIYDADNINIIMEQTIIIDSVKAVKTGGLNISVGEFVQDSNKYKAKVSVTMMLSTIIFNGGRFSIRITHDNGLDGIYYKEQLDIFYDTNAHSSSLATVMFNFDATNSILKFLSGIRYYDESSAFEIDIYDIDYVNYMSYPLNIITINSPNGGFSNIDIIGNQLTGWTSVYNIMDISYQNTTWQVTSSEYCYVGSFSVRARTEDYISGNWINSAVENICICTYTNNSTRIFDDFKSEFYRLCSDLITPWNSNLSLATANGGNGLQVINNTLIYPSIDYSSYHPTGNPNYSLLVGTRVYYRRFWHNDTAHSNGCFRLGNHNITESDIISNNIIIQISLDGTNWYSVNKDYLGGILSNGDGCRINADTHKLTSDNILEFTFGSGKFTSASTGGGWGIYIKISYLETQKTKYIGSIEITNWI